MVAPSGIDSERGLIHELPTEVVKKGTTDEKVTDCLAKKPSKVCPDPGETDDFLKALRIKTFPLAAVLVIYDLPVPKTVCELTIPPSNK